ncbi:MAG: PKD domain-containing protein [Flavobacteriales bacterium]|nr:PKD domain-containing protein [Flavobacteriales bacterium]
MMNAYRWWAGIAVAALSSVLGGRVWAQCTAQAGPPTANTCAGVPFILSGSGTGNAPLYYNWSGSPYLSSTNTANTLLNYPVPLGAATVVNLTLTVTDDDGCTATDVIAVTVNPTPQASITSPDPNPDLYVAPGGTSFALCGTGLANYLFQFADASTAAAGATFSVDWGTPPSPYVPPASGWTQDHSYGIGLHTITYTVTNPGGGCAHTETFDVFLGSNPSVGTSNPGNTLVCSGTPLTFPLNNTPGNSPGTQYVIDYGDGNGTTFTHPPPATVTYNYPNTNCPGAPYTFRVDAITPCPITSFATAGPIYITDSPQASFTMSADTACAGSSVSFTNTSLGVGGAACSQPLRVWTITPATGWSGTGLGALNGSNLPNQWTNGSNNLSVQFTQPGTYCITLNVGNNLCGVDDVQQCICVEGPPQPAFTLSPAQGCAPFTSTVDNTSTSPNSCRTTYAWNVGTSGGACGSGPAWNYTGGTNASSVEPQFQFTQAGTYSIQLQATNSCGTFQQNAVVVASAPPQVDVFDLPGICATQCVDPGAIVQDCGGTIGTYEWTFPGGTPNTADVLDPAAICFNSATSASISLTVTNACGSATDVTTLSVGALPAMPVISTNSPVCAGQILSLSANNVPGLTYHWTGPNGFTSSLPSVTIPSVTATNAGTYSVVALNNGCEGPPATVTVQVIAAPTLTVTPASDAICNGEAASFTVSGAGNYQWFIGSTLVGTGPLFNTSPAISTTYTVSGDLGGCPGSATVPITVFPVTNVNAGANQTVCDQAIGVQLTGFPSPGTWSGPNVTATGVFTPVPDQLGPITLTYTHTDGNGCTNDDEMTVNVQDLTLIANAGNDTVFCQSTTPVMLPATPAGGTWVGAGAGGQFTPNTVGTAVVTYNYGTGTCATSDQVNVEVLAAPTLGLPADFVRCADAPAVTLGGTPVGGVWSGAGVSGPPYLFDPAVAGNGPHTLNYTYSDGAGCTSTGSITATVNALPVVNAGSDVQLCDQPIPFQLTATPAGGTWSATTMSVTPAGVITPGGVGSDVLTYTYADGAGCSSSDQITVNVVAITEPAFAGNDTAVCIGSGDLQLTGTPVGGTWSGTGVSTSGLFTPNTAGTFTLTYSFGSATCLLQDQVTVIVHPLPVVDAGEEIATCPDGGLQVLSATPAGGTWSGTGVDAAGNFDPLAAVPGGNTVTYTYTDVVTGCTNSATTLVTVNPLPVAAFAHDPVACADVAFPFTNTSTGGNNYEWNFGDGGSSFIISPQHIFTGTGTFDIRLIVETGAGCRDTAYSAVDVWDVPVASVVLSTDTGCGPLELSFTNNSTGSGLSYAWEFGGLDGSADEDPAPFTFPPDNEEAVTYDVALTVTNVCGQDDVTVPVVVIPPPTAEFGPNLNEYCSYAEVPFGNASYGVPSSIEWLFGDGESSTDPGPVVTHSYVAGDDPLPITVALIATNICGTDTAYRDIIILPNQVNAFFNTDPVQGCSPLTVDLTQFSSGDTTFYWDLGDGNVSEEHDLSWTYTEPGTYTIELFAYGCGFDSYTTDITVYPAPDMAFTFTPATACVGEPFSFYNGTANVGGLNWDLGDGTTSSLTDPVHSFEESGTYDVTLTATMIGTACTSSITHQVVVQPTPQATFTLDPLSGCIDLDVAFDNTSIGGDFSQWDFGDDNTSSLTDPFHTYSVAGTYTVELVSSSLNGCTDTASAVVVAHPIPTSAFSLSVSGSCGPQTTVQAINSSQGAVGYTWDLGNGGTSELNQPAILFDGPGVYTVTLTATNQFGCDDVSTATFIQYPTPTASFITEPDPGCEGYPIDFLNTSQNGIGFEWRFGDGNTSNTTFPMHAYDDPGVYDVELIVHGEGGCSDTLVVPDAVHVLTRPLAAFAYDTLESITHALQFRNESEGAVSYTWDFGDGEFADIVHPLHVFPADGGGFVVCLVAVNELGCPDTVCVGLNIPGDPNVFVPNAFTPNSDTRNDTFRPILNGFVGWNYRFMVFDRWGMPVYDTRDRSEAWDGTRKGVESPVDVYVWKVIVERDGDAKDFVGHVSLVR